MGAAPANLADDSRRSSKPVSESRASTSGSNVGISDVTFFHVYEIGALLGSGSFGQVRVCRPTGKPDGRMYAVKVVDTRGEIFQQAGPHLSAKQEVSMLKLLQQPDKHPHIVELIDSFEQDRWFFLVMECVVGGDLFGAFGDPQAVVTESNVATVGRQLLEALLHLHERKIVHRDVKAENLLLQFSPAKTGVWYVKLIDFGLAIRVDQPQRALQASCRDQVSLEELICGTAYYCAPEVWVNECSPKVDVWAAGVVLYLALHGAYPFYHSDPEHLETLICDRDTSPSFAPARASECPGYHASKDARRLLVALLAKDQHQRPSAKNALLQTWFRGVPSSPRHASDGVRSTSASPRPAAGDQPIPLVVRLKASRAAAKPPVNTAQELARTTALEAIKARARSHLERRRTRESRVEQRRTAGSNHSWESLSDTDIESVEHDISQPILDWEHHDLSTADMSLSDSEAEDGFGAPMCMCNRSSAKCRRA
mmetsp:Transcript_29711/g.81350  ORF Transcript_29711/g.81350 Transcript_29711/m.81350 type:complete len:483 (-) Transcript_29711:157-1605(-)